MMNSSPSMALARAQKASWAAFDTTPFGAPFSSRCQVMDLAFFNGLTHT
jgi:hypothetical protein